MCVCVFAPQDKESMFEVMKVVDKASGYVYGQGESTNLVAMMSTAVGADFDFFKYPWLDSSLTCTSPKLLLQAINI